MTCEFKVVTIKLAQLSLPILMLFIPPTFADELTLQVEQELMRLGYATGEVDGEGDIDTAIAVAKYQAEHDFSVTGEVSQELAEALSATDRVGNAPRVRALGRDPSKAIVVSEAGLSAAREACLKGKMMMSRSPGVTETVTNEIKDQMVDQATQAAFQASGIGMAQQVYNLYSQWDSKSKSGRPKESETGAMAKSLGISEDDIIACQRPVS